MCLDPRPSPHEVDTCFAGDFTNDALQDYLLTLQADPNWRVIATPGPATWDLALTYWPAGTRQHIHLDRRECAGAILWRRMSHPQS